MIYISVFLQWTQVYKVIRDPNSARDIISKNWAAKVECAFVFYFTCVTIASIYFSMWDHVSRLGSDLDTIKLVLQILNEATMMAIIIMFTILLVLFMRLIKGQGEFMQSMKCQVGTFFSIAICSLTIKFAFGMGEALISYSHKYGTPLEHKHDTFFLIDSSANLICDIAVSAQIIFYLYTSSSHNEHLVDP